jgi:hypothetical protein
MAQALTAAHNHAVHKLWLRKCAPRIVCVTVATKPAAVTAAAQAQARRRSYRHHSQTPGANAKAEAACPEGKQ